jgi:KaiC/GvpD/RAD55 family RecA-like ATPase
MKTEHVPTGIPGLDDLLAGGYPRGRVILITGGPGSGKTLMAIHLLSEMQNFGWDLEKYEKKNQLAIVDASPLRQISKEKEEGDSSQSEADQRGIPRIRGPEFSIQALSTVIRSYARVTRATRIVIDPITSLSFQFPDEQQRRSAIIDLLDSLMSMGTTNIVTSEMGALTTPHPAEEYLCHGVVVLHAAHVAGRGVITSLEIEKMRETKHDRQLHRYSIGEKGITVESERFLG